MLHSKFFTAALVSSLLLSYTNLVTAQDGNAFAPTQDPGVYPGGDKSPPDGWRVLPTVDGARIDNTTLIVGQGSARLVHYIDADYDPSKIKRAVIQIHGENRDAWNQWMYADLAASRGATGGSFNRSEVVVMAPMFMSAIDEGAYPYDPSLDPGDAITITEDTSTSSALARRSVETNPAAAPTPTFEPRGKLEPRALKKKPIRKVSTTEAMIWQYTEWGEGAPCYEPANAAGAGSFEALDAAVAFFLNKKRFPHLRKVVVAGFSLGAQLTNRYATFRSDTSQDSRIIYWISSPNSFVYLTGDRPARIAGSCSNTYNDYKYGLSGNLPPYYTNGANTLSSSAMISRYLGRTIYYLVGLRDKSSGLDACAPNAQGRNHLEKMYLWTQQVIPMLPGSTGVTGQLPENNEVRFISETSHQDWKIITSDPGVELLVLKQWYANGTDAAAPSSNGVVSASTPSPSSVTSNDAVATVAMRGLVMLAVAALSVVASLAL